MKSSVGITIRCVMIVLVSCSLVTQTFGSDIDWRMIKEISIGEILGISSSPV